MPAHKDSQETTTMRRTLPTNGNSAAIREAIDQATEPTEPPPPPRSKGNGKHPMALPLTLQELLDQAATDPASVFAPDALATLAQLLRDDRAAFERVRDRLKKYGVRTGELAKLVTASAESGHQDSDDDVDALVARMNQQWSVVRVGGKVAVMTEELDKELGTERITQSFLKAMDFRLLLKNQTVRVLGSSGKPQNAAIADVWLEHKDRLTYQKIGMYPPPLTVPAGHYNLWRGFGITPRRGNWPLLFEHFDKVLTGGNDEVLDYQIKWTAYGLQNLARKVETSLLFIGQQGGGKGTFANVLLRCYGSHGLYLNKKEQLVGRFNAHLSNALLAHIDESFFGGDRASAGVVKSLITETRIPVEPKFMDIYEVTNRLRLIFTSNEKHALHLDYDDRRAATFATNWIWHTESERLDYFNRLHDEINNGGVEAFLFDMLQMDLTGFDPRVIPATLIRAQQKTQSLHGTAAWWHHILTIGDAPWCEPRRSEMRYADEPSSQGPDHTCRAAKSWLYGQYVEWAKARRDEYHIDNPEQFWIALRKLVDVREYRPRGAGRMVALPPLDMARQQFEKEMRSTGVMEWSPAQTTDEDA
jgi:Family of unknown function (DUF5906)